jgi:hypothetical protein
MKHSGARNVSNISQQPHDMKNTNIANVFEEKVSQGDHSF